MYLENLQLIKRQAQLHMQTRTGLFPLSLAAITSNAVVMKLLLDAGAPDSPDSLARVALHWAADANSAECCKLLLANQTNAPAMALGLWCVYVCAGVCVYMCVCFCAVYMCACVCLHASVFCVYMFICECVSE
jgi:ankyrin repeat protein